MKTSLIAYAIITVLYIAVRAIMPIRYGVGGLLMSMLEIAQFVAILCVVWSVGKYFVRKHKE